MKYLISVIGSIFLTFVVGVCIYLFAGAQGFVHLPSVSIWARPFIVYAGESRVWRASDQHNHWEVTIALIDPHAPGLQQHEFRLFSMPIPGPFNPLPLYPRIVQVR